VLNSQAQAHRQPPKASSEVQGQPSSLHIKEVLLCISPIRFIITIRDIIILNQIGGIRVEDSKIILNFYIST
jgi:hypothetical protein